MNDTTIKELKKMIEEVKFSNAKSIKQSEERHLAYQKNDAKHAKALNDLKETIDDYIKQDMRDKQEAKEWRVSVTPSINTMKSIENWSSTTAYLLKTIVLLGAFFGAIYALWAFIKHNLK